MNRKQFLVLLATLAVLLAAGAGVLWTERTEWKPADSRVGQKLFPDLKISEVAQLAIREPARTITLAKGDSGWTVKERGDFPADEERIGQFLIKLVELKIVQDEPLPEPQRARLQLAEAKGSDTRDAGSLLELKDKSGKILARALLGKKVLKKAEVASVGPPGEGMASGRYVLAGEDRGKVAVVPDPVDQAEAKSENWIVRDLIRVERLKAVTATGADGKVRFSLTRADENAAWKLAGSGENPDAGKVQDVVSSLTYMALADVVADSKEAKLEKPVTVKAETFDNLSYTLRVGEKASEDRYFLAVSVSGEPSRERTPAKAESAEDREKHDKEFAERTKKLGERLEREKRLDRWTYLVSKSSVDPLLRERTQLLPEKKKDEKKKS